MSRPRDEHGYTEIADLLTAEFCLDPPMDRRQVYMWAARGSRNQARKPFPAGPPFSPADVIAWYAAGQPSWPGWGQHRDSLGRFTGNNQVAPDVDKGSATARQ